MGSSAVLLPSMCQGGFLLSILLISLFSGLIPVDAIIDVNTVDLKCCPYKTVSSGNSEYAGSYRLIPDDQVYNKNLPEECSYSCVYVKDGNHNDQFCFRPGDPNTEDSFSLCEAEPSGLSPLLTTPEPLTS